MIELADAVVVGGGILGIAVTEALSRRFSRVLLLEANRCGARATAGGFAWVNASSKWEDEAYHRLNAEACMRHISLAAEWDAHRIGWNGGGTLMWADQRDRGGLAALENRIQTLQRWEYPVARISRQEMQALEPYVRFDDDAVGLFAPSEGWISTARLVRFYADQAREHRAEIAEYTEAEGFTLDHRGAISSVETHRGRVSTRVVVLCAGAESGRLVGLALRRANRESRDVIKTSPGLLVETEPVPANSRIHRVCYPASATGLHLRPTPEGGLLIGADDTDELCGTDNGLSGKGEADVSEFADATAMLTKRVNAVLPAFEKGAVPTARRCVRPIPSDGLPLVGELPGLPGAYMLASHSGVTLAPLLSSLLADEIITGRRSPWLTAYRPERLLK